MRSCARHDCSVGARRVWPPFDFKSSSSVEFSFSRSDCHAWFGWRRKKHVSDKCSDVEDELSAFVHVFSEERSGTFGERVEGLLRRVFVHWWCAPLLFALWLQVQLVSSYVSLAGCADDVAGFRSFFVKHESFVYDVGTDFFCC